jgi:hypothetical protein
VLKGTASRVGSRCRRDARSRRRWRVPVPACE